MKKRCNCMKYRAVRRVNALVFVLMILLTGVAAIDHGSAQTRSDTWKKVTDVEEIAGSWEGSIKALIPGGEPNTGVPSSSITVTITLDYVKNGEQVTVIMKVDLDQLLTDLLKTDMIRDAGYTKDNLWDLLVLEFNQSDGLTIDKNYTLYSDISEPADDFIDDETEFALNGTSLRLTFNEPVVFGLGDTGFTEIVLNRRR
ncbi:hypothetical protein FACS189493_8040 [Spirochaetia bacterium]|nr:hypothetical protein FACS189493_8040 [Spirochaetia bacterium]